jgi:hypothetical protein
LELIPPPLALDKNTVDHANIKLRKKSVMLKRSVGLKIQKLYDNAARKPARYKEKLQEKKEHFNFPV